MLRAIRLFVGAAAVLFGGIVLAQPKDAPNADGYFPLKVKTKWTYKIQDQTIDVVVAAANVKYNNEDCVQVDTQVGGKTVASELYAVKADGVYRVKVKDDKVDPPVKVLALPVKKDATWDIKSSVGTQKVAGTFKIKNDADKLKIMDKEITAVLVEGVDIDVAGTKTTVRTWYAKDKGIVKIEYKIQDATTTLELTKSESPPG